MGKEEVTALRVSDRSDTPKAVLSEVEGPAEEYSGEHDVRRMWPRDTHTLRQAQCDKHNEQATFSPSSDIRQHP